MVKISVLLNVLCVSVLLPLSHEQSCAAASTSGNSISKRWEKEPAAQEPQMPREGAPGLNKKHKEGWRMLKPGQKVSMVSCQANPVSCLCPPSTVKVTFQETQKWGGLETRRLMCVPAACPRGKLMRQRRDAKTGILSYRCEEVPRDAS